MEKSEQTPVQVFDYQDYREFLSDYIAAKKAQKRGFSVRGLCLKAGLSTENYLLRVLRKQRNLGPSVAERLITALPLRGPEAQYFRTLVYAESARSMEERSRYLDEIQVFRRRRGLRSAKTDNTLFRRWYILAIWELSSCRAFELSPESAVAALGGKLSLIEAREAIELLVERGHLVKRDGQWRQGDAPVVSTDGTTNDIVRLNHRENLERGIEAIALPIEERGFFGLTLAFDEAKLPEVKQKMRAFVQGLQAEYGCDPVANRVYRMNAEVYPLSARVGRRE